MKYKDIINEVYNIIDETDYDEQIEVIVKGAINSAYRMLCEEDTRLTRAYLPIVNGVVTLPINLLNVKKIIPELGDGDYFEGNTIITDKEGVLEILYTYIRDELKEDEDEPDIHDSLINCLISYACYKYFLHRKKSTSAQMFLTEYTNTLMSFRNLIKDRNKTNTAKEFIQDAYSSSDEE